MQHVEKHSDSARADMDRDARGEGQFHKVLQDSGAGAPERTPINYAYC